MSVQTGITPDELLAMDARMFDALVTAAEERWPLELELQAQALEVASAHLIAFLRVNAKQGTKLPDPLSADELRPEWAKREQPREDGRARISVAELAKLPGLTAELRGTG